MKTKEKENEKFREIKDGYMKLDTDSLADALWNMVCDDFDSYEAAKAVIYDVAGCESEKEFNLLDKFFTGIFGWSLETTHSMAVAIERGENT